MDRASETPLRRLIYRVAAAVVVCVFASLPTLARVHDQLSTRDDGGGFKLSKNLERPHEKLAPTPLAQTTAARVVRDDTPSDDASDFLPSYAAPVVTAPAPGRAPPVR
jgi:hypothetical protein